MKYDFVIFGATGFTGQFVVEFLAKATGDEKIDDVDDLTWAVAGRSEAKLTAVLEAAAKATEIESIRKAPMILCDINEEDSIRAMAGQAKVVLNCVGPYRFMGEIVVKACVEVGASHVDLSGEVQFLEGMQLKYHEAAEKAGVFIIGAVGFDSIPNDMGHVFLADNMEGDLNSVETFLSTYTPPTLGPRINFGTWQSAIHMFSKREETEKIREKLFSEPLPEVKESLRLNSRGLLFYNEDVQGYCVPFPNSPDEAVMTRTQRSRYEIHGERPVQVKQYIVSPFGFIGAAVMIFVGFLFYLMISTRFGLYLMENYPRIFSFGLISKDGPSLETSKNSWFRMTLVGEGWKDKAKDGVKRTDPPNRKVVCTVFGTNPGYGSTCECMVQAAMVIVRERERMPKKGGVFTPGYAFAKTSIVERLTRRDVPFSVELVKDL